MKHPDSEDQLYKKALSSSHIPSEELNNSLFMKMEARSNMNINKKHKSILKPIMVAALIMTVLTTSVFAAWRMLTPADVAEIMGHTELAAAFRESKDAIFVNETKSQNGYDITFLGIISGKGLSGWAEELDSDKTYAIVAIAKQDGVMPQTSDDDYGVQPFFVSPLIKGQKPWMINIATMGGGYSEYVIDGVMYRIIQCDSIEMFADRGLFLCVSSTTFYNINAFDYDESTGLVTPNPQYDGVNILFDLPLDVSKADYEKAEAYLDELLNPMESGRDTPFASDGVSEDITEEIAFIEA